MSIIADEIGALPTSTETDVLLDLVGRLSPLAVVPADVLIAIFGWLSMREMLAVVQVSFAWRQLALQTATLWWDLTVFGDIPPQQSVTRFLVLLQRSRESPIRVTVANSSFDSVSQALLDRLRAALIANRHRIIAFEFPRALLYPCQADWCGIAGNASSLLGALGIQFGSQPWHDESSFSREMINMPSFNLQDIRRLIVSDHQHICPVSYREIRELEVDSQYGVINTTVRLVQQHPNTRILSIRASCLDEDLSPILQLQDLVELRVLYDMYYNDHCDALASFVMQPVIRRVVLDMWDYNRRFLSLIRRSLRECASSEPWHVTFRSGVSPWPQDSPFFSTTSGIKTQFTIELKLSDERERVFLLHKFSDALERMVRPLLNDQRTTSVSVDGAAALRLFYSGVGDAILIQLQTLRVATSDDASLVVPLRRVGLPNLRLVVLDRCVSRGSRLTTGQIEAWLAGMRLDTRPDIDLKSVFVYEEGSAIVSANLAGGRLYQRSWLQ